MDILDEYVGVIKIFAGKIAPKGWDFCDGRMLMVSENMTLFNLIGYQFGGSGQYFALPDLRSRMIMGANPKSTQAGSYKLGQTGGEESVMLTYENMPRHNHGFCVSNERAQYAVPKKYSSLAIPRVDTGRSFELTKLYRVSPDVNLEHKAHSLDFLAISIEGKDERHSNIQPSIGLNYIICTTGANPQ